MINLKENFVNCFLAAALVSAIVFLISWDANDFETDSVSDAVISAHIAATFRAACEKRGGLVVDINGSSACKISK